MTEVRASVDSEADDALCCPRCIALGGYDDAPDLTATVDEYEIPTSAVGEPHHERETVPALGRYCDEHDVFLVASYSECLAKPTDGDVNQESEDDIFITRLPVGLWHKLGNQSAKRKRGEEYQFLRPALDRRGRRSPIGLTVACSLTADDHIVCSFVSRGSRLRRSPQTPVGRRYDGSTVRQRWNVGTPR
ncbi:hypothetical protein C451_03169 [Halococcus thailandensis JCM 13552]|uniref:Uncharacterized protein n=1 Tax=Halococcus thailandensis JCM 13552 TaxID=1227457 RepID=M0NFE4_9EURY|nr:hypothetical protein C451_03169 [Halococcus thailandensis JCM 13552]